MKRLGILAAAGLLAVAAAGCGSSEGGGGGSDSGGGGGEKVQVAATMTVFQDMTEEVGGDRVEVETIVPIGASVETFQPSPSDAQMISESELVVQNGLGLESWLQDLIESAGGEEQSVELSEGLETIEAGEHGDEGSHEEEGHSEDEGEDSHSEEEGDHAEEEEGEHSEEEGSEGGHDAHAGGDPHLWLDVENGEHYVERIRDGLIEADPEGEEEYRENAEEYLAELEELDGYMEEQAEGIPEENRKLITTHEAFAYFAEAYGFELEGSIIQNPEAEPGSREVAEVVEMVEDEEVPAIFTEPQFNSGLADTIAAEADVEVEEIYSDTLTEEEAGESYEAMMRTNIDRIAEALG